MNKSNSGDKVFNLSSVDAAGKPQSVEVCADWSDDDGRSFGVILRSPSLREQNINYRAWGKTVRSNVSTCHVERMFDELNSSLKVENRFAIPTQKEMQEMASFINKRFNEE